MKNKVLILGLILFINGCSSTLKNEDTLNYRVDYTEETSKKYKADKEWWKDYNDEELNKLVDLALKNNIDYAKSILNVESAYYKAKLAKTNLFPVPSANLGASSGRDISQHDNFKQTFSGDFSLNYEIDLWNKIRNTANAEKLEYKATEMDREAERLVIINDTIDAYYNLAYLKESAKLTEENLNNYKVIYNITNDKYTSGKVESIDLLKAKQSLMTAENNLTDLNNKIKDAEQTLRNLLNLKPSDELNINFPSVLDAKNLDVNIDIPLEVLAERPDLKASELRLEKAFKNWNAEKANMYPSISLKAAISSSSDKIRTTFDFPSILGSVSINLPFLDWNTVRSNIKISETEYKSTLLDFEKTINTALNEVAYYYFYYSNSKNIFSNLKEKYEADNEIAEYQLKRFRAGKIELSDLLDSLNSENSSRLDVLLNAYQVIKNENMIYKAMAGRYSDVKEVKN